MIIFTPFYICGSGIVAFLACGIGLSCKVLTSFSFLLKARLRSISCGGLVSLLIPSIADLWLFACGSFSFT